FVTTEGRSVLLLLALLEGRAEDVTERGARIGRAVLGDRFLLLRNFIRLDGEVDLAGLLVGGGHARIDLLADREAFRTLVVAVACEIGAADERGLAAIDDLNLDAAVLDLRDLDGDDRVLPQRAARRSGFAAARGTAFGELLDAERDALLLDIDVENDRL